MQFKINLTFYFWLDQHFSVKHSYWCLTGTLIGLLIKKKNSMYLFEKGRADKIWPTWKKTTTPSTRSAYPWLLSLYLK